VAEGLDLGGRLDCSADPGPVAGVARPAGREDGVKSIEELCLALSKEIGVYDVRVSISRSHYGRAGIPSQGFEEDESWCAGEWTATVNLMAYNLNHRLSHLRWQGYGQTVEEAEEVAKNCLKLHIARDLWAPVFRIMERIPRPELHGPYAPERWRTELPPMSDALPPDGTGIAKCLTS
jgi:hypothetical protein